MELAPLLERSRSGAIRKNGGAGVESERAFFTQSGAGAEWKRVFLTETGAESEGSDSLVTGARSGRSCPSLDRRQLSTTW
jgi:hypothetical protein